MNNGIRVALSATALVLLSATFSLAAVQSVPEPATMTLLALGGASAFLVKRRRS